MASLSLFLVGFFILAGEVIAMERKLEEIIMEEEELQGLFQVMGSFLGDPAWAQEHPQPCTDTPWPGVECEIGQGPAIFHVTKIHIGPDVVTPPCKPSANLSDSLLKLTYLKTLSVFNCFVTSPVNLSPILFSGLSSLEHLSLQSNPSLSGEIPSSLTQIPTLRVLSLSENNLQGNIPVELDNMVSLQQLDLSHNNLSGGVPKEIGGLKSLAILDLSWNNLEGELPSSLGQLQFLQKIDLSSNRLAGTIPPEIGKLNRLVLLDLSQNLITGPIPETLSGLEQLQYLIVDRNPINSPIPLSVGTLQKITSISFSACGLTGQIPNFLSSLKNLTALSLDNNSLTGTVPPDLGLLPNLYQLNLSHNLLSGQLTLPENFITRLGKRLDVRGNSGLCTSNELYKKNFSIYLQAPPCMDSKEIGSNKTWPEEHGFRSGIQPPWYYSKTSSSAATTWLHLKLITSTSFALSYSLISLPL